MRIVPNIIYNLWRKHFGRFEIIDPRPNAQENPYSFYLPPRDYIELLSEGDHVKLILSGTPASREWERERMWVNITDIKESSYLGTLDNDPDDLPMLTAGTVLLFSDYNIIAIELQDGKEPPVHKAHLSDLYWDRCMVDDCILYDGVPVGYLYKEKPDMGQEGDQDADSGWRIRGYWAEGESEEDYDNRTASYIALCKVLNEDDSWIHLIDEPEGSSFTRNIATNTYKAK